MMPRTILRFVAAAPIVVVTLAVLVFSLRELSGGTPSSFGPPRNVAEAAGLGNGAEVLRLMRAGQDPRRMWPVRGDIISSSVTQVTGFEAAVWSRKGQLIELFDRQGVLGDPEDRRHMLCLARDLEVQEIVDYLSPKQPATECQPQKIYEEILARTRRS